MNLSKLKGKPILLSIIGWLLFLCIYLDIGVFTALGISVEASVLFSFLCGIFGLGFWITAFISSILGLFKARNITASIANLIFTFLPFALLGYGFSIAIRGGV